MQNRNSKADISTSASLEQNGLLAEVKLTKSALNDFIKWSTSRYNNYCGYDARNILQNKYGEVIA